MKNAAAKPVPTEIQIKEDDLNKIRGLIYKETGMLFEDNKNYYLDSRIRQRMAAVGSQDFKDYFHELVFGDRSGEVKHFVEAITINETYFFRDFPQLQGFADEVLPRYCAAKQAAGDKSLNIWSAACSTGEEPYTLSIILQEVFDDPREWNLKIYGTDIDRTVLAQASEGRFTDRSVKDVPSAYKSKYFQKTGDLWRILPNARGLVNLKELNLIDRSQMRQMRKLDFIFCRNVLIYFDDESRKKVVSMLYDALAPGGYLFLGHSESVGRITAAFELERMGEFLCYKRPRT